MGYDVPYIAANGEDAIDISQNIRPDLVLMDVMLQGQMDGIDAAGQIRLKRNVPIIYLSAYTDEMLSERAKHTEPFGYLSKPFADVDLRNSIEMALYKHGIEKALRRSEEKYRLLFNNLMNPITVYDLNGNILVVNNVGAKNLGRTPEELEGKSLYEIIPEAKDVIIDRLHKVVESEQSISNIEALIKLPSGEERWFLSNHQPLRDESGKVYAVQVISYDITKRKMSETKLQESENKLRLITENAVDYIFIKDINRRYTFVNKAMKELLGLRGEEILGKTPDEIFGPAQGQIVKKVDDRTFSGEVVNEIENLAIGDKEIFFNTLQTPLTMEDGNVTSIMGIVRDVSKLKRAENDLIEAKKEIEKWNKELERKITEKTE